MFFKKSSYLLILVLGMFFLNSCGGDKNDTSKTTTSHQKEVEKPVVKKTVDPMDDRGVGPVKELTLPAEIDQEMAAKGKDLYKAKCTACHKAEKKFIGPAPKGIFERRNPAWVMNMILNPDVMIVENEAAKKLLMEFNGSPMANQNLSEDEARAIVEYFRTL